MVSIIVYNSIGAEAAIANEGQPFLQAGVCQSRVTGDSYVTAVKSCIVKVIEAPGEIRVADGTGTHVDPTAVLAEIHGYPDDADWFFHTSLF